MPRFLLKRFADDREQVVRVVLPGKKSHRMSVNDATVENGFYLLLDEDGHEVDDFERWVGARESEAAEALRHMLDEHQFPPSNKDREAIALLVALQYLRTPAVREHGRSFDDAMFKMDVALQGRDGARRVLQELHGREPTEDEVDAEWQYMSDPDKYRVRASPARHIHNILELLPGTAALFRDRSWILMRWQRKALILSDSPVVLWRQDNEPTGTATADAVLTALDRRAFLRLGSIGDSDGLATGTSQMAKDLNQVFVAHTKTAFFHHPDDAEAVAKLRMPKGADFSVERGASFESLVRMGDAIRGAHHDESGVDEEPPPAP